MDNFSNSECVQVSKSGVKEYVQWVMVHTRCSTPPSSRSSSLNHSPARLDVRLNRVSIARWPAWSTAIINSNTKRLYKTQGISWKLCAIHKYFEKEDQPQQNLTKKMEILNRNTFVSSWMYYHCALMSAIEHSISTSLTIISILRFVMPHSTSMIQSWIYKESEGKLLLFNLVCVECVPRGTCSLHTLSFSTSTYTGTGEGEPSQWTEQKSLADDDVLDKGIRNRAKCRGMVNSLDHHHLLLMKIKMNLKIKWIPKGGQKVDRGEWICRNWRKGL